jgi:WhiB family redox-sensing transcriptional regulator
VTRPTPRRAPGNASSGPTLIQVNEAKAVCHRCPVRDECLDRALRADWVEGIWGGTTEAERRALLRRGAAPSWPREPAA